MSAAGDLLPPPDGLFDSAACGLLVTTADGTILRVNAMFCQWTGYVADDLIDKRRFQDLLTMGGKVFHQTHWAPLLEIQGSVAEVKLDVVHRDAHPVPMLLNALRKRHGESTYQQLALLVVRDRHKYEHELLRAQKSAESALSERNRAESALQESRDVLGLAMRGARMGVWSREFASNRVWWSRELEELLGFKEGGFPGTTEAFRDLVHHDDRGAVAGAVEQAVADGRDYLVEFRVRHADGDWRWMEGRGRATYDAQGQPLMVYGLGIDITGRKHAESILLQHESRLRQLNAQLSEADRRKDEFLATLAHELRNPLAPMRNVAEVLRLKKLDDDPQLRWSRDVLERQLEHLSHLVDDLLDVSRITQGKLEPRKQPLELAAAIHDAIESAKPLIDEFAHELTLQLPQEPIVLNADPVRIIQVVLNLLNNAAKYTPRGGRIFLCAERIGDEAVITVRDSGIGIPQQHLSHIFDMFSQLSPALDRSQGGLGIGLALVRGMVKLHGGSVSASSPGVGEGSTFEIRLPLATSQHIPQPLHGAQESAPVSTASIRRVLVVDDNEDAAESLAMLLSLQDHVVRTANDGLSALAIAADFAPDVVLLDIGLPHLNGYEIARRIRQARWGSAVLLLAISGWGQEQDKKTAADAGFDAHLTKPIDPVALISLLAAHRQPQSSAAG